MFERYLGDREQITNQSIKSLVIDLRDSWRAGDEVIQKTGLSRAVTKIVHPPTKAAGSQLDPECLENYDRWGCVECCRGGHERPHAVVAHMKLTGCDQVLCDRLPVAVCYNFGRR